jgi:hypothetical protein
MGDEDLRLTLELTRSHEAGGVGDEVGEKVSVGKAQ